MALRVVYRCANKKIAAAGPVHTERRGGRMVHVLADEDRERALALKIVQAMNNIHAAGALINQGHLYEWRAVERIALEGVQEILFLELGIDPGPWTKDHQQWLDTFYQSEYDASGNHRLLPIHGLSARKIREFLDRHFGEDYKNTEEVRTGVAPSTYTNLLKMAQIRGSGFVHGRAESIMEYCYDPTTGGLTLTGLSDRAALGVSRREYWNSLGYLLSAVSLPLTRRYGPLAHAGLRHAVDDLLERGSPPSPE